MSHCTEVSHSAYVGEAGWNQCWWKNSLRRWMSRKVKAEPVILFQFCSGLNKALGTSWTLCQERWKKTSSDFQRLAGNNMKHKINHEWEVKTCRINFRINVISFSLMFSSLLPFTPNSIQTTNLTTHRK